MTFPPSEATEASGLSFASFLSSTVSGIVGEGPLTGERGAMRIRDPRPTMGGGAGIGLHSGRGGVNRGC